MSVTTVGIDPGITGAMAVLNASGELVSLQDLPVIADRSLSWVDGDQLRTLLIAVGPARVIVERVGAMPGQGVASSFKFGCGFGSILGVIQVLQLPLELVTPSTWKRDFGLSRDKHASLHKARLLFPHADLGLLKHHNKAEALLLANWGYLRHSARSA